MSEPAKKPSQQPESYQPKKPEMMRALEEAQGETQALGATRAAASAGGSGIIPHIRYLVKDNHGENYWFNGCMRYVLECLGEPELDYGFFAGITGDNFTQFYPKGAYKPGMCAVSDYFMGPDYAKWVFDQVGYACEYVTEQELLANFDTYLQKIMSSIDRGIPVINCNWGVFVGYEDGGKTLLYITHEMEEPGRLTGGERFTEERKFYYTEERSMAFDSIDLIFVGEKKRDIPLAQIYRDAIARLPALLTKETEDYYFGAGAFRAWADDIENGKYDDPAVFDEDWWNYTNYVCVLATNGSDDHHGFDRKVIELNPDMAWLEEVSALYKKMGNMWHKDRDCLEKLGGGFNVSYKTLQNKKKRAKIVAKIREFADVTDEVVRILEKGVQEL